MLLSLLLATAHALQPVGTFHDDEPVARDGEHWLALRLEPGRARLVPTRVRVQRVHDPVLDAEGEATGLEVGAADADPEGLLLRGPLLRPGLVARATGPGLQGLPRTPAPIVLGARRYAFGLRCPRQPRNGPSPACSLVLAEGGREQVLTGVATPPAPAGAMPGPEALPTLLFAGDLDHDGRLDLVLDVTDHENVSEPRLFLSSQAGAGELVRAVAAHRSAGC